MPCCRIFGAEGLAGLVRVGSDVLDRDAQGLLALRHADRRVVKVFAGGDERFQPAPQAAPLVHLAINSLVSSWWFAAAPREINSLVSS